MTNSELKQNIELLLPFYVNGTLDKAEHTLVENALADDESLQQELIFLQGLQTQVQQQEQQSPGELGLKRLQKMLRKEQENEELLLHEKSISAGRNRWQIAAIAACLMLVVQNAANIDSNPDVYMAAGGNIVVQHEGKIVGVTFAPDVTEQHIRNLLLETNTFIIDGPSALGIYRIAISDNFAPTINQLKARTDLIESLQEE